MAGELISGFGPQDLYPERVQGYDEKLKSVQIGALRGVGLPRLLRNQCVERYNFTCIVPAAATLSTGVTVVLQLVDDATDPRDLGKVIQLGVQAVNLSGSGAKVDLSSNSGAEQTFTATLSATSLVSVQVSVAIANAQLASLAAGNLLALRIRRLGDTAVFNDNTTDTCPGRPVLLGGLIKNT
jgi:hypothetical protein